MKHIKPFNKINEAMEAVEFIKVSVEDELPEKDGKYIVFTKTEMGGNILEASFHYGKKKKPVWSVNNQIVTHWLKPTAFYRGTKH